VDEVWAISEFSRRAIAAATKKPVFAFPLPVAAPRPRRGFDRSGLGLPDGFLFLFCFDFLSVSQRKNPRGLIEAFSTAFAPGEGPTLVLKAINGEFQLAELEAMKLLAAARPDIIVIDRYLDDDENAALMDACDCYVSLHRSEGFGLTMAEAMALGKPVIATAYSGNLDFMDDDTAYLVPWTEGWVPEGCPPYRGGARWAEPDIAVAAQLMRSVVQNPEEAAAVGARAQRAVLGKHGLAARAALMKERFAHAQEVLATRSRASGGRKAATTGHPQRGEGLELAAAGPLTLPEFARSRADLGSPTRHPRISRPLRRLVARVTAHSDAHRAEVDGRLADALLALETTVSQRLGATSEQLAGRARLDAHLQRLAERSLVGGAQLETLSTLLHEIEAELRAVPYMSDPAVLITTDAQGAAAIGYRGLLVSDGSDSYAAFEDIFRGPQDFIRERMRPYLDLVRSHEPIVDIGCGRGEFLDLLASEGIHATGVDLDPGMVDICRGKGYEVAAADALSYLRALDDGSLGTIFSAQFIEHLSPLDLVEYLRDAQRVLRDDGVFIAETVNPHSIQAFKTFWTDLTHRAPIFPEVAVALCRSAGFESAIVMFPNGNGDLDHDRRSTGEYAVVARKGKSLNRSGSQRPGVARAVPSVKGPAAPTE
jgi:SAM-dependent methyltransferase